MHKKFRLLCLGFAPASQYGAAAIVLQQSKEMTEACLWLQAADQRKKDCLKYSILSPVWQDADNLERAALKEGMLLQGRGELIAADFLKAQGKQLSGIVAIAGCNSFCFFNPSPFSLGVSVLGTLGGLCYWLEGLHDIRKINYMKIEAMKSAMLEHAKKHTAQEK